MRILRPCSSQSDPSNLRGSVWGFAASILSNIGSKFLLSRYWLARPAAYSLSSILERYRFECGALNIDASGKIGKSCYRSEGAPIGLSGEGQQLEIDGSGTARVTPRHVQRNTTVARSERRTPHTSSDLAWVKIPAGMIKSRSWTRGALSASILRPRSQVLVYNLTRRAIQGKFSAEAGYRFT
ncbi:hypothetical protein ABIB66_008502 [Bradyrhizobium sp. F1.13.3]